MLTRAARVGLAVVALATVFGALSAGAAAARYEPGAPGLGDPFFPFAGNGGYAVSHYSLSLD